MAEPGVHAEFFLQPILHPGMSRDQGRQVFVDKVFVRITVAGSRDVVERNAQEKDRIRFPVEWAAWESKQAAPTMGTPVKEWPALTPAQVRNLEALHIRTIEDMAGASDTALQKIGMGARDLQAKAKLYLSGNTRANDLEARAQTQQKIIDQQAAALAQLEARLAAIESGGAAKTERKPMGLPKKAEAGVQ